MQDTESEISAQIQSQREIESAKSYKYLSNANLNLADLGNSLFDCKSLNSTGFIINSNQMHIVDSNLKELSSCQ
jgi:hypothetical protein